MIKDGIINESKYNEQKTKILWILKEPNSADLNWTYQDLLASYNFERVIGYPMFKKIIYTSYAILNGLSDYEDIELDISDKAVYGVTECIAYINIKKTGGTSVSDYKEIKKAYQENKELLYWQIKECNPSIIIFGNTLSYFEFEELKKIGWDLTNAESGYADTKTHNTSWYKVSGNKLVIHAYHPAYWTINQKVYCNEILNCVKLLEVPA